MVTSRNFFMNFLLVPTLIMDPKPSQIMRSDQSKHEAGDRHRLAT